MKLITLLLTLALSLGHAAPVIITTTGEAPAGLVTEEEYQAREAARPPATGGTQEGVTVVKTEAEFTAALLVGKKIVVPGINLVLSKRFVTSVRGTVVTGLGAGNSKISLSDTSTDGRLYHPSAPDCTIQDLTLSGGAKRVIGVHMDGLSRNADRQTLQRVNIESVSYGILLDGGPGNVDADIVEDFQFLQSRITDFNQGGVYMSWEMLRPRFQDFVISGLGTGSAFNGIWLGLGVVDAHIINGVIAKVGRIGLEIFYAHGTIGGPAPALLSKQYPNGPGVTVDNLSVSDTGSMGISLAGCKRSNIGSLTVRNSNFIGVEFVDEDPSRSDYNVSGPVCVTNHTGWSISIDQIKGGQFSGLQIDTVNALDAYQWGMQIYYSDDVTFKDSTFTNAGPRYIQQIMSTRCHYIDNHFVAKAGEVWGDPEGGNFAFYGYGGDAYFHGNVIRGSNTNQLRTCFNACATTTSPTSGVIPGPDPAYPTYWQDWQDGDNYRGRQFVKTQAAAAGMPAAAKVDLKAEVLKWKAKHAPKRYPFK